MDILEVNDLYSKTKISITIITLLKQTQLDKYLKR